MIACCGFVPSCICIHVSSVFREPANNLEQAFPSCLCHLWLATTGGWERENACVIFAFGCLGTSILDLDEQRNLERLTEGLPATDADTSPTRPSNPGRLGLIQTNEIVSSGAYDLQPGIAMFDDAYTVAREVGGLHRSGG